MSANKEGKRRSLYQRIGRLRWQAAGLALVLVLLHQWIEHAYLFFLPRWSHFWTQVVFYGMVGPLMAWLALTSLRRQVAETEAANQRLEFLARVEHRMAEAADEATLLEAILALPLEVLPALGTTLVRFDAAGSPESLVHHGQLTPEEFHAWERHLAAPAVQTACAACGAGHAEVGAPCPLLERVAETSQVAQVVCLPLSSAGRKFAVLNIYLEQPTPPTAEEQELLTAMANAMSVALEGSRLRSRELSALYRLRQVEKAGGLERQLTQVLTDVVSVYDLAGGAICLSRQSTGEPELAVVIGGGGAPAEAALLGLAQSVMDGDSSLVADSWQAQNGSDGQGRTIVVSPLWRDNRWLGSLLVWSDDRDDLAEHQVRFVEAMAAQAALLVHNHRLYQQAELRAGLAERARLAREIHDGLAQTLGYLKLKVNQVQVWLAAGTSERAADGLAEVKQRLADAYIDAREAIDGLRLEGSDGSLEAWLTQIYQDFEALSRLRIQATAAPDLRLSPEVQSQLLRILQEALANVRKHAAASTVQVSWSMNAHWLVLAVIDDGIGFDPQEVAPIHRHGLQIMRERAELLGAELQLQSRPAQGTRLTVRLPRTVLVEAE